VAKTKFKSVDEYITGQPKHIQEILKGVRRTIRKAVPTAIEEISYQIPAYKLNGTPMLYFAGWKHHYSLYPASDALAAAFRKELAPYELRKGTMRIPISEPMPLKLIERIAKFRAKQLTMREKGIGRSKGRQKQLERVRQICARLPSVSEKLSHGAPTFFVSKDKGVFAVFADNRHEDGYLAVWLPVPEGLQSALIEDEPKMYFKPPYVGVSGWVGIDLDQIADEPLEIHLRQAWEIAAYKKKKPARQS
jgi:uncharacterized protein YdhG (YjbR/CyaY superfamily)